MSSLNKVTLIGNLTRDPEIRYTNSGGKIVNMSVATSEQWKDKTTGERKEKSEFHNVTIFDERLADVAESYLKKGSQAYLEGQLQTRKWQDQSGNDRYTTEVVLQRFGGKLILLGGKPGGSGRSQKPQQRQRAMDAQAPVDPPLDDEIPF